MKRFAGKKTEKIISFLLLHPNSTIPEIIDALGGNPSHARAVLQKLAVAGVVERRSVLTKRSPQKPWVNAWRVIDGSQ